MMCATAEKPPQFSDFHHVSLPLCREGTQTRDQVQTREIQNPFSAPGFSTRDHAIFWVPDIKHKEKIQVSYRKVISSRVGK